MSLNKFMHPRNIYRTPLNFEDLCKVFPEFENYVQRKKNGKPTFSFKNQDGLRCLTTILLKRDFDLNVIIPEGKLIPRLPLRLNYILWLEDLLFNWQQSDGGGKIKGIDIGTGATCIYALLAAKKNGWEMLGTEIDEDTVEIALENVKKNGLLHLIEVRKVSSGTVLKDALKRDETFKFCMCNPPFFKSEEENYDIDAGSEGGDFEKETNMKGVAGSSNEVSAVGGEVEFVKRIIQDSVELEERIKIYTTMLGHKSSIPILMNELKSHHGICNVCQAEFCQGRTKRWAIAWTFTSSIILNDFLPSSKVKAVKPITWVIESKYKFKDSIDVIGKLLVELRVQFNIVEQFNRRQLWRLSAFENTWTGLRRKRRENLRKQEITVVSETDMTKSDLLGYETDKENPIQNVTKSSIKRKFSSEEAISSPNKKLRLHGSVSPNVVESPILGALLSIRKIGKTVQLQMFYECGKRDAPQQLLQFLKNNLT